MGQTLVIRKRLFNSINAIENKETLNSYGFKDANHFFCSIIERLNDEYNFLEIKEYRFALEGKESSRYSQYGAFVDIEGDSYPYKKVVVFFTPINSKVGNVIIEQSLMPTICKQMEDDIDFLINEQYKKIVLLTSRINSNNKVELPYNKMQMDVNSLNTLGFDVIPFIPIKNLSTDTKFNSLTEYIEMSDYLQQKSKTNSQTKNLLLEDYTLWGDCEKSQWEGEFPKSFCFRFLSAIFSGKNEYKYDINKIISKLPKKDNQLLNLEKFINHISTTIISPITVTTPADDEVVEGDDDVENINDIHRKPQKAIDKAGRKRYKTQKKIRDYVLEKSHYLCNCNDKLHFYFESVNLHNYVEGHHIVPMNRQEEYYFDKSVNLDIPNNIVPLCPNCHSQIHLGSRHARIKIISELFVRNKAKLMSFDSEISLSLLASYYNIGLTNEEENDWLKRASKIISEKNHSIT